MLAESIDSGELGQALRNGKNRYIMGPKKLPLLLQTIGTKDSEIGAMISVADSEALLVDPQAEGILVTALNLAAYAFDNMRLQSQSLQQNEKLRDLVAKRTRAYNEAAEEAKGSARVKTEFLANMSHEIRTPLNGIIGLLELLDDGRLSSDQHERVQTARTCADHLLLLLNDILDLAKVEAGRMQLNKEPFKLIQLAKDVLSAQSVQKKAQSIRVDLHSDIDDLTYHGDAGLLRQVLFNLIGNAIKFTDEGSVTLHLKREAADTILFSAQDTGCGISPEDQRHIFESFSQANNKIRHSHGGTGLGLAISSRLVELMGGSLTLSSQPRIGSTFSFAIPLPESKEHINTEVTEKQTSAPLDLSALTVLVAEDNPTNRLVVKSMLARIGCTIHLVEDGTHVQEAVAHLKPDLILMDVEMPILNGYDATSRLREHENQHGGHIPVIALTAHAMNEHKQRALAAGMDDHLAKPITLDRLKQCIEHWAGMLPGFKQRS